VIILELDSPKTLLSTDEHDGPVDDARATARRIVALA
jgi:hypothetical protein